MRIRHLAHIVEKRGDAFLKIGNREGNPGDLERISRRALSGRQGMQKLESILVPSLEKRKIDLSVEDLIRGQSPQELFRFFREAYLRIEPPKPEEGVGMELGIETQPALYRVPSRHLLRAWVA